MENKRVSTGCKELDKMLNGGLLPGSANLLEGAAGTGKSTLGIQFLMEGPGMEKQMVPKNLFSRKE